MTSPAAFWSDSLSLSHTLCVHTHTLLAFTPSGRVIYQAERCGGVLSRKQLITSADFLAHRDWYYPQREVQGLGLCMWGSLWHALCACQAVIYVRVCMYVCLVHTSSVCLCTRRFDSRNCLSLLCALRKQKTSMKLSFALRSLNLPPPPMDASRGAWAARWFPLRCEFGIWVRTTDVTRNAHTRQIWEKFWARCLLCSAQVNCLLPAVYLADLCLGTI